MCCFCETIERIKKYMNENFWKSALKDPDDWIGKNFGEPRPMKPCNCEGYCEKNDLKTGIHEEPFFFGTTAEKNYRKQQAAEKKRIENMICKRESFSDSAAGSAEIGYNVERTEIRGNKTRALTPEQQARMPKEEDTIDVHNTTSHLTAIVEDEDGMRTTRPILIHEGNITIKGKAEGGFKSEFDSHIPERRTSASISDKGKISFDNPKLGRHICTIGDEAFFDKKPKLRDRDAENDFIPYPYPWNSTKPEQPKKTPEQIIEEIEPIIERAIRYSHNLEQPSAPFNLNNELSKIRNLVRKNHGKSSN